MADTIRKWQTEFKEGLYSSDETDALMEAGWYDWNCSCEEALKKTTLFGNVIVKLTDSDRLNLDTMKVWFKGNLPIYYPHYEDFRISDVETGRNLYVVCYREPFDNNKFMWSVYDMEAKFEKRPDGSIGYACKRFKTTKQMIKWFNIKEEETK